jgi:hypothetical protein
MYDLSILIPARNEMFVKHTVEDILKNKRGKTEVIVGLDGEWADPGIPDHPDVRIVHVSEPRGQRAMTNMLAKLSKAKYVAKCDAHTAYDEGFDVKLMDAFKETGDNTIMCPVMRNLWAFSWKCMGCGKKTYQGKTPTSCEDCNNTTKFTRKLKWYAKPSPQSTAYTFDTNLHFQYHSEWRRKQEGELVESMSLQGSFFMLTREKYWELNICDEKHGSWGQQGVEIAMKFWLSGGQVIVNKRTWYAHLFRTAGGDFSFPYEQKQSQVEAARKYSKEIWFNNAFEKQIYPLSWVIEKFAPINGSGKWVGWHDSSGREALASVNEAGATFTNLRAEKLGVSGIVPSIPGSMADETTPVASDSDGQ